MLNFIKFATLFCSSLFISGSDTWKVQSSDVTFAIKYLGTTVNGTFSGMTAELKFDPLKPEDANIKVSVDAKTIETGIDLRNKDLRANFFESDKYPKITMQSIKIEKTGPITYMGTFNLSLKNITKEIKLPFVFMKTPEKTEFKGNFVLNRLEFGVGEIHFGMADDVNVSIDAIVSENTLSATK